jgi:glucokinase
MSDEIVLAADIGGTQMRAALVDATGTVLVRRSEPTPAGADAPSALIDLLGTVAVLEGHGTVSHAVVGLPGSVDYTSGHLLWAPNLHHEWPDRLSRDSLAQELDVPVYIANDADMAAVGEAFFGAGADKTDVAYLTVSTGIGAGVVQARRLVRGRYSLAEVGHTVVDWQSWHAGRPGTLEELASGSGVARQARESGLEGLDARGLRAAATDGDERAAAIWQGAVDACAVGIENLIMSFSPTAVVIGGGLGRQEDFFNAVRDHVVGRPEHHPPDLEVLPASCGDDAGLVGAAGWAEAISPA